MLQFILVIFSVLTLFSSNAATAGSFEDGMKLSQEGKYDQAIGKYKEALKKQPKDPRIHNMLGMAYRMQFNKTGDKSLRAMELQAFRKATEVDDSFWIAHKNAGVTLYYSGQKAAAAKHLQRSLELFPKDPEKEMMLKWIAEGGAAQKP